MAGHVVTATVVGENRLHRGAPVLRTRTAGPEPAPTGRVHRRGRLTLERHRTAGPAGLQVEPRYGVQQRPGVRVAG